MDLEIVIALFYVAAVSVLSMAFGAFLVWWLFGGRHKKQMESWQAAHLESEQQLALLCQERDTLATQLIAEQHAHEESKRRGRGWYRAFLEATQEQKVQAS